jgi:signal transduction histidine kinase
LVPAIATGGTADTEDRITPAGPLTARAPSAGGTVVLSARPAGAEVVFSVADSGPGIPPEDREHLFDSFRQARDGDRRGVGLGLAITRGIVEAHGGRIRVESTLGAGSTFWFALPAGGAAPTDRPRTPDLANFGIAGRRPAA